MKRAMVMLVLLLCSIPLFARNGEVSKARCVSLEHVRGGWVMNVECVEGSGHIVAADSGNFAGDGVFANWSKAELGTMYRSLIPKNDGPAFETLQLG